MVNRFVTGSAPLYKPTEVIYVCGLLINDVYNKLPLSSIIDGLVV